MTDPEKDYIARAVLRKAMDDEIGYRNAIETLDNRNREIEDLDKKYSNKLEEYSILQKKVSNSIKLVLHNAGKEKPKHGQICICITTPAGFVMEPKDFIVLKYNDKAKYWDDRCADVDDQGHPDGVFDYGDYKVIWWMPIYDLIKVYEEND